MKNKFLTSIFLLFGLFLLSQNGIDYYGAPLLKNYSNDDFETNSSQIWCITQDNNGIMYFGSNEGLLAYDGSSWERYPMSTNTPLRSIAIDEEEQKLYVGSYNDFGYFEPNKAGKLKYHSLANRLPDSIKYFRNIWKTHITTHGVYFVSPEYIFKWNQNKLDIIFKQTNAANAFLVNDRIFLKLARNGIAILEDSNVVVLPNTELFSRGSGFTNVNHYRKDEIVIVSAGKGIYSYNIKNQKLSEFPINEDVKNYLFQNRAYASTVLDNLDIAIATRKAGVLIINKKGKISQIINTERGLKSDNLYSIFYDKDKHLWISSDIGISKIDINVPIIKFDRLQGINDVLKTSVIHDNTLYTGTVNNIMYLEKYQLSLLHDNHKFKSLPDINRISFDFHTIDDRLFVIGDYGLAEIKNKKTKLSPLPASGMALNYSKRFPDKIFLAFRSGFGFADLHIADNKEFAEIRNITFIEEIFEGITQITFDEEENIWLSTFSSGPIYIRFHNNNPKDYTITKFGMEDGLPKDLGFSKTVNLLRRINLITINGIYKPIFPDSRQNADSKIKFIKDPFWGNEITSRISGLQDIIRINDSLFIVIANQTSFVKIQKDTVSVNPIPFRRIKNILHIQILEEGKVGIATTDSYVVMDMQSKMDHKYFFKTLIRKVIIDKDSTFFNGYYTDASHLSDVIQPESSRPDIGFTKNTISFEFAATYYEEEENTKFSYKLEGFDDSWSNWSKEKHATYTNLSEGNYTFRVKSKNIYQTTGSEAYFNFKVKPPWYRNIVAYIIYFILGVNLIYVLLRIFAHRIRANSIKLERKIIQRTIEINRQKEQIESQSTALQTSFDKLELINKFIEKTIFMLVHDLKNPLASILKITKDDEILQPAHSMQKIVLNMLDISKSKHAELNVFKEFYQVNFLVDEALKHLAYLLKEKRLTIIKKIEASFIAYVDSYLTIRIFENILTNSIKYSDHGQEIIIRVFNKNDHIVIEFKDFGKGMTNENLANIYDEYSQFSDEASNIFPSSGLGTTYCKIATEAQGGTIEIESKLGEGTTVRLKFTGKKTASEISNKSGKQITNLSLESIDIIKPVALKLNEIPIFEASRIMDALKTIETENDEVNKWCIKVKEAIFSSNKIMYKKLIHEFI